MSMANSDESSNHVMPPSDGNEEIIKAVKQSDKDPQEVWRNVREDGTNFARTPDCETEKPSDANEEKKEDNNIDSACKISQSIEKNEDFHTGAISNNNLAQTIALTEGNEEGITIQMVSEADPAEIMVIRNWKGENDPVNNPMQCQAMSKINHGQVEDGREEIIITATMTDADAQDVMDQSDKKREEMSNAMIDSHEQDTDISTVSPTIRREPVSKTNRIEKVGTCIGPILKKNYRTYRRDKEINTEPISSTNFQHSVARNDYSEGKLKISKANILKPKRKEQKNTSRASNTKSEIHVAENDKDDKSVNVNVDVVSKTKPQHAVPLLYNIEEDVNVQETSDDDGEESNNTTTSNTNFEGVWLEDEDGTEISTESIDYPDSRESTVLMNNNENVILNRNLRGSHTINWYNYVAKVRQLFRNVCVYLLIFLFLSVGLFSSVSFCLSKLYEY